MKPEPNHALDIIRRSHVSLGSTPRGVSWGYFEVDGLRIISSGAVSELSPRWEHVSVSRADRVPSWDDMKRIKDLFWRDDETVVQFHPRAADYVNTHPFVLHLWRDAELGHPLPPRVLIG